MWRPCRCKELLCGRYCSLVLALPSSHNLSSATAPSVPKHKHKHPFSNANHSRVQVNATQNDQSLNPLNSCLHLNTWGEHYTYTSFYHKYEECLQMVSPTRLLNNWNKLEWLQTSSSVRADLSSFSTKDILSAVVLHLSEIHKVYRQVGGWWLSEFVLYLYSDSFECHLRLILSMKLSSNNL